MPPHDRPSGDPELQDAELERAWATTRRDAELRLLRVVSVLCAIDHLLWAAVDSWIERPVLPQLLVLRVVDNVAALVLYLLARREARLPRVTTYIALRFSMVGLTVGPMLGLVDHYFVYALGFSLVFWGQGVLAGWPTKPQLAANVGMLAVALAASGARSSGFDMTAIGTAAYLASVIMVVVAISAGRLRLERRAFVATHQLAAAKARLERLDRVKTEFFSNITHELRTPLTLVLAPLDALIEQEGTSPENRHHLACMQRSALRLLSLINDLLSLTRLETVGLPNEPRSVDLAGLVRGLADEVRPLAAQNDITMSIEGCDRPVFASVDPRHLDKLLLNLLSNALKFTDRGGRVTLSVTDGPEGIAVAVRDTGIGIPREAFQRIFDRFEQLDGASTRAYGGAGIGLSLVAALTRLVGGEISVASEVGAGSCFTLRLPPAVRRSEPSDALPALALPDLGRRAGLAVLERDAARPEVRRAGEHGARVLVAEDDPDLNRELVSMLSERFRVVAVGDGEAALERATAESPDIVVSDVMMPKIDGVQLCASLRERPDFREIPIILLSARSELEDRIRGREVGADTYLTKPFNRRELVAAIEGLLRARMRLVGSYLIRRRLGSGGQGNVFVGEHHRTGELAAVKIIADTHGADELARRRLRLEREALARLQHPNIVRVLEHGEQAQSSHLAMELLRGRTLLEVLASRPGGLGAHATAVVGERSCDAVAAVHRAGLVHGDLKLGNLMLTTGAPSLAAAVRLIDFGAARDPSAGGHAGVLGTMRYVAPEVLAGSVPSPASDVFGLGACLLHMAAGDKFLACDPPPGAGAPGAVLPASALAPGLDPGLAAVIDRALEPDPGRRWPSAGAMADELRRIAARLQPGDDPLLGPTAEPTTVAL